MPNKVRGFVGNREGQVLAGSIFVSEVRCQMDEIISRHCGFLQIIIMLGTPSTKQTIIVLLFSPCPTTAPAPAACDEGPTLIQFWQCTSEAHSHRTRSAMLSFWMKFRRPSPLPPIRQHTRTCFVWMTFKCVLPRLNRSALISGSKRGAVVGARTVISSTRLYTIIVLLYGPAELSTTIRVRKLPSCHIIGLSQRRPCNSRQL